MSNDNGSPNPLQQVARIHPNQRRCNLRDVCGYSLEPFVFEVFSQLADCGQEGIAAEIILPRIKIDGPIALTLKGFLPATQHERLAGSPFAVQADSQGRFLSSDQVRQSGRNLGTVQ